MKNTKTNFQLALWNNIQKETTKQFIDAFLNALNKEINQCLEHFHFKEISEKFINDYSDQHQFFWVCIEPTWVNLLSNALIRTYGEKVSILSELSLHSNIKFEGKPDLLVHLNNGEKLEKYLFECKMGEFTGYYYNNIEKGNEALLDYYNRVDAQAKKYEGIIAEHLLINYQPTRIAIVFDWIRTPKAVADAASSFAKEALKKDPHTNFSALYTMDNSGVFVYGKVFEG
jgi:hypothetical protein